MEVSSPLGLQTTRDQLQVALGQRKSFQMITLCVQQPGQLRKSNPLRPAIKPLASGIAPPP
ncbi:unnamed protein product, partial [Gulo gulo]